MSSGNEPSSTAIASDNYDPDVVQALVTLLQRKRFAQFVPFINESWSHEIERLRDPLKKNNNTLEQLESANVFDQKWALVEKQLEPIKSRIFGDYADRKLSPELRNELKSDREKQTKLLRMYLDDCNEDELNSLRDTDSLFEQTEQLRTSFNDYDTTKLEQEKTLYDLMYGYSKALLDMKAKHKRIEFQLFSMAFLGDAKENFELWLWRPCDSDRFRSFRLQMWSDLKARRR